MSLKDLLQQFLNDEKWEDEIRHDDDDDTDFIRTDFEIDGQSYGLILITAEQSQTIRVVLISPIKIPKPRAKEAAFVLNYLNSCMSYGHLQMTDDGEVCFRWAMDVEGATAAPAQFAHLIAAATAAFDELRRPAIGAAAFTKQSADDIIAEFKKEVEKAGKNSNEAPSSL